MMEVKTEDGMIPAIVYVSEDPHMLEESDWDVQNFLDTKFK